MGWLNYHHLYYFWITTQEGSLARAAVRLHLTHSTLSSQIQSLEAFLEKDLFERKGRRLVLTSFGAEVVCYANDIFRTGSELVEFARGQKTQKKSPFRVGAVASIPKAIIYRLINPAMEVASDAPVQVTEEAIAKLIGDLRTGALDVVLSDAPLQINAQKELIAHPIGRTGILLFGTAELAAKYGRKFPTGLENAPLVLPNVESVVRKRIEKWFSERSIQFRLVGEIDDARLLRVFGGHGKGLYPVRAAMRSEIEASQAVECLGELNGVFDEYYAIAARQALHPAVTAMLRGEQQMDDPGYINQLKRKKTN